MSAISSLKLPVELKRRIERVAKERDEEPASLLASAMDSLLSAQEAQLAEVRRRDQTDSGEPHANDDAFAKLDSLRPSHRRPSPE